MANLVGQPLEALDTPQLLLDLDGIDANLKRMFAAGRERGVNVRVHFKSLKCGGLAKYTAKMGGSTFLAAKLNEAEVLADAGITDILIANQVIGAAKLARVAQLAKRVKLRVCVDDPQNVDDLSRAAQTAGATIGVLVEVDIGMLRCGVAPGEPALVLAQRVAKSPGLRFDGLQGYDGHLQLMPNAAERRAECHKSLEQL